MLPGFELWVPPKANQRVSFNGLSVPAFEILGTDAQYVSVPLPPGRSVMCMSGHMAYMSADIIMEVKLAGFMGTVKRVAGGGSLFLVTYTNSSGSEAGYISMTPDYPGIIVPICLHDHTKICAMRDSYVCSFSTFDEQETQISAGFNPAQSVAGFCCSGIDFIVQTLSDGEWVFLQAMGTVITRTLAAGEVILVDTRSILCFDATVTVDIRRVGGCCAMFCAGAGLFHTEMHGPGKIWMQSMSIDKLRDLFPPQVVESGGGGDSGGSDGGG